MTPVPKVSVCIPTYNTARFLPEAIESVFAQVFQDYELIVCDNASTDETPELCARYAADSRFRYVRYDQLTNQGGNWNRCLELARGRYLALLHADDRYLPTFLAARVEALDRSARAGIAFGSVQLIDNTGAPCGEQVFAPGQQVWPAPEFLRHLLMGCVINPVAPLVRSDCYRAVGTFRADRLWGIDWDMWIRLAARYDVVYEPAVHAQYRVHNNSGTSTGIRAARNGREELEVLKDAIAFVNSDPKCQPLRTCRRAAYRRLALRTLYAAGLCAEQGNREGTRINLLWTVRTDPSLLTRATVWRLWFRALVPAVGAPSPAQKLEMKPSCVSQADAGTDPSLKTGLW